MSNYVEVRGLRIGEGIPKICVPIISTTKEEILKTAEEITKLEADIVEWRADWFEDVMDRKKVGEVLAGLRKILGNMPLLFTFRTTLEGGEREIEDKAYAYLLMFAIGTGLIDLVDVQLITSDAVCATVIIRYAHSEGVKVIGSYHNFRGTGSKESLMVALRAMEGRRADILKIAVMPEDKKDVKKLLAASGEAATGMRRCPIIAISMGDLGVSSRLYGEIYGSSVTFGAVGEGSAPGQIPVKELAEHLQKTHSRLRQNIFLIGFMGTGKSAVAKELKKILGTECIEMDEMIASEQGMTIPGIFRQHGEDYFRDLESVLLARIREEEAVIVSCGGGVVLREKNTDIMRKRGRVVWLTATPKTILNRVKHSEERPILNGNMNEEFISQLMEKRRDNYKNAADLTIKTGRKTPREIAYEILEKLVKIDK